jgi:hypothetical protein
MSIHCQIVQQERSTLSDATTNRLGESDRYRSASTSALASRGCGFGRNTVCCRMQAIKSLDNGHASMHWICHGSGCQPASAPVLASLAWLWGSEAPPSPVFTAVISRDRKRAGGAIPFADDAFGSGGSTYLAVVGSEVPGFLLQFGA